MSLIDLTYMHIKKQSIYAQYKENSGKWRYFVFKMTGPNWTDQQLTIWQINIHAAKTFTYEATKVFGTQSTTERIVKPKIEILPFTSI